MPNCRGGANKMYLGENYQDLLKSGGGEEVFLGHSIIMIKWT